MKYPNTLKQHRLKYNLLQSEVATLLGLVGSDRISLWEQGKSIPSIPNLFKLCVLYRVQPFDVYSELVDVAEEEIEERKIKI